MSNVNIIDEYDVESPLTTVLDHPEVKTGRKWPVLPQSDRNKALIYTHSTCGQQNGASQEIVNTVLSDITFYDGLWCKKCKKFVPMNELYWTVSNRWIINGQEAVKKTNDDARRAAIQQFSCEIINQWPR